MEGYHSFLAKKIRLEAELEEERLAIRDQILTDVRECVREFNLSIEEVFPAGAPKKKRAPKYFDPETGDLHLFVIEFTNPTSRATWEKTWSFGEKHMRKRHIISKLSHFI
ncbi:H-NS family nucleoid-associated regulatory protein [Burkholderia ubonensis]|uniref:H-NS family nucleoid-associated regulatory protein n=1 Tax=Burkholderia ubonensis TaxID=101571 RepID=UPI0008FE6CB0|nr:H-NS family nucleoid-associated regulatory protein [Burkholderia ubonensis]